MSSRKTPSSHQLQRRDRINLAFCPLKVESISSSPEEKLGPVPLQLPFHHGQKGKADRRPGSHAEPENLRKKFCRKISIETRRRVKATCSLLLGVIREHQAPVPSTAGAVRGVLVFHTYETVACATGTAPKLNTGFWK